jgi:ATP-dependent RNA helicase DDX55/SPB4
MADSSITAKKMKAKRSSSKKRKQQNESEEGPDRAGDGQDVAKGAPAHDDDEHEAAARQSATSTCSAEASSSSKQSKKRGRKNKGKDCDDGGDDTSSKNVPANSFASVSPPLSEGILSAVESYKFQSMTPVQSAVIPLFLTNKDVCVQAVTGSGKTLAFLIPAIEMILRRTSLLKKRQIGGLVISPTRELARQTHAVAADLCRHCSLPQPLLLVGGANRPVSDDLKAFVRHGSDIIVATPGRLDDVMGRYDDIDVSELEVLVLDEADVLLDMGFEVTLTNILARLPRMRRTGLFSATKPSSSGGGGSAGVKGLIKRAGMRNPVVVDVAIARATTAGSGSDGNDVKRKGEEEHKLAKKRKEKQELNQATPSSLTNYYLVCPLDEKLSRLVAFLKQHKDEKVIVFFLTCACVEFYGAAMQQILTERKGFYLETLHGKLQQKRREKAMERFRDCDEKGGALLCTDIASRGLDVAGIQWTVQFDAPVDPSSYVHRVGRSARAGATGSSLIFLTPKEEAYVDFLRMRKVPLNVIPDEEMCAPPSSDDNISGSEGEEKDDKIKKNGKEEDVEKKRAIRSASDPKTIIPDILPKIKSIELNDRDVLEKGTKAFTSYIRAYKEHQCAFIFR